jgi:hypothetical protein
MRIRFHGGASKRAIFFEKRQRFQAFMIGAVTCLRCRQAANMDLSGTMAWIAMPAMWLYRLWFPFGEVQQDLLLSSFTIGQAHCLLEVLQ